MSCLKSFHLPLCVSGPDLQLLTLRDSRSNCQFCWRRLEEWNLSSRQLGTRRLTWWAKSESVLQACLYPLYLGQLFWGPALVATYLQDWSAAPLSDFHWLTTWNSVLKLKEGVGRLKMNQGEIRWYYKTRWREGLTSITRLSVVVDILKKSWKLLHWRMTGDMSFIIV